MNLYLLTQEENTGEGTFDSCVVVAESGEDAKNIHPFNDWDRVDAWTYDPKDVTVVFLGEARKDLEKVGFSLEINNVICSSLS
tara:strand:+ start:7800 stop:8048 length:249 start_codon:yes stop_codon:yes gene_type:complete